MSPALTDWNHVVGTSKPPSIRFVRRSVKRFRLEPACSKASQKTALKSMKTKIVVVGPRSFGSSLATNRTAQPITTTTRTSPAPRPGTAVASAASAPASRRDPGRVELPHHHRDAGLEVSGADHDERQPEDEHGHAAVRPCERSHARHGEHEVAERDQEAPDDHRAVRAQQPVGDPPADDREQVREAGVPSVEEARVTA